MAKKQIIIHAHNTSAPSVSNFSGKGEILVQHQASAAETFLHTLANDGSTIATFPTTKYVEGLLGTGVTTTNTVTSQLGALQNAINENANTCNNNFTNLGALLPSSAFTNTNTVEKRINDVDAKFGGVNNVSTAISDAKNELKGIIGGSYTTGNTVHTTIEGLKTSYNNLNAEVTGNTANNIKAAKTKLTVASVDEGDAGVEVKLETAKGSNGEDVYTISGKNIAKASDLASLREEFDTLVGSGATEAIDTFNEITEFLTGYKDNTTLAGVVTTLEGKIESAQSAATTTIDTAVTMTTGATAGITITKTTQNGGSHYTFTGVDIASASNLSGLGERVKAIEDNYTKDVKYYTANGTATTANGNVDLTTMWIDGGEY